MSVSVFQRLMNPKYFLFRYIRWYFWQSRGRPLSSQILQFRIGSSKNSRNRSGVLKTNYTFRYDRFRFSKICEIDSLFFCSTQFHKFRICNHKLFCYLFSVLDEIDQLDSKSQEVLYSLFELPYLNKSKLVLVGIANALDLTDRILPRLKMHEGFSPAELIFPAYSKSEILAILKTRLAPFMENTDKPLFQSPALMFLAGKISG